LFHLIVTSSVIYGKLLPIVTISGGLIIKKVILYYYQKEMSIIGDVLGDARI
jgi:hypothetical protein